MLCIFIISWIFIFVPLSHVKVEKYAGQTREKSKFRRRRVQQRAAQHHKRIGSGQRLTIFQITLALSINSTMCCVFFSRKMFKQHVCESVEKIDDGRICPISWNDSQLRLLSLDLFTKWSSLNLQFISTRLLLIPLCRYFFPTLDTRVQNSSGFLSETKRPNAVRRGEYTEKKMSRECPKLHNFPLHERKNWVQKKENNEERKKSCPDGNCNNITLDQTSTYPHPKWWFGIFSR